MRSISPSSTFLEWKTPVRQRNGEGGRDQLVLRVDLARSLGPIRREIVTYPANFGAAPAACFSTM